MDTTATGAQQQPDDTAAIRALIEPWSRSAIDRDWDAMLAMCTYDIVFSPPGEPKVSGTALRPWLEAYPIIKEFNWGFDEIEVSGDLAVGVGWGEMTVEIEGQEASTTIKLADALHRGEDGTWRFSHVIWNENEAAD